MKPDYCDKKIVSTLRAAKKKMKRGEETKTLQTSRAQLGYHYSCYSMMMHRVALHRCDDGYAIRFSVSSHCPLHVPLLIQLCFVCFSSLYQWTWMSEKDCVRRGYEAKEEGTGESMTWRVHNEFFALTFCSFLPHFLSHTIFPLSWFSFGFRPLPIQDLSKGEKWTYLMFIVHPWIDSRH